MAAVSVAIDSIAAGGDGVGRTNGLVVFVPRTAPGDVVTAQIAGKGHFARGILRSVVTPSPDRIEPPCPHYTRDKCGGCQLQHLAYEAQLEAKRGIIRDSLQRIGKRQAELPPMEPSPKDWRYRTKLTLTMRRRGARWIAGLHPYDDPVHVFACERRRIAAHVDHGPYVTRLLLEGLGNTSVEARARRIEEDQIGGKDSGKCVFNPRLDRPRRLTKLAG